MKRMVIANGTPMGTYCGEDREAVLDNYARDAGYKDYDDLLERVPGSGPGSNEVELRCCCEKCGAPLRLDKTDHRRGADGRLTVRDYVCCNGHSRRFVEKH